MSKPWRVILAFLLASLLVIGIALGARAARAGDDADANWQPGLHAPGMDGTVQAFCEYRGDVVVGGSFRTIGAQVMEHVARWDGTAWHALGTGVNASVGQLAVQGGKLLASGEFTVAGGTPVNHIAMWDGVAWRPLGDGVDSAPKALAVYRDTLFVGGEFRHAGGLEVNGIARWDGEAWHDGIAMTDRWPTLEVTNLAVAGDHLAATYVERHEPGDIPPFYMPHPVLWNGAGWDPMFDDPWNNPYRLAVLGDSIYAAGYTEARPALGGYHVSRWTGTEWLPLGGDWPDDLGIPVGHDGDLYLARRGTLHRWTGREWIVASRPRHADFSVLFSGSDGLYTGGARVISSLDTGFRTAHGLARWDGTAWSSVGDQTGDGLNLWLGAPHVVLAAGGEGFSAGGTFLRVGDLETIGLVQWDGSSWWPLPGGPGPIRANAFFDLDGRLAATSDELSGTGCTVRTLEGSRWKNLMSFPGKVITLTPWRDSLVVGGDFAPEHILTVPQVMTDPDFVPRPLGAGLDGPVLATCLLDGSVVAAGDFSATADGGVQLSRVGLWDGASWLPLGDGLPASALTLQPFAGGVAAAMSDGVILFDGAAWGRLGDTFDGPVQALAVFEGELVAGGAFTRTPTVRLGGLARWHNNQWQPIGSGMNGEVQDLLVNGDELWASGAFTAAGNVPSAGIAHWQEPRAGVESFYALVQQDSVFLSWRDPESPTHRSTVVRWSAYGYPTDPQDGRPLPFGEDGRFPASPGTVHPFHLILPFDGGSAFYSVFAVHADGRSSAPGHARVRLPDRTPPAIALQTQRLAGVPLRLAITLRCGEPLVSTGVTARLDSATVRLIKANSLGTLWTGTAEIAGPGSSRLTVCARDSLGNEACADNGISTAMAQPHFAGQCPVPGGRLLVEWPAGAFASEGWVTVIGEEAESPGFEVTAHEPPVAPLVLSFQVRPGDLGGEDPMHLGVRGPDGSVQGGVFDAASGRLVIRSSALGSYRLVLTPEEASMAADQRYLFLRPAVPNPFRNGTSLGLELLARQRVRVTVHDVSGRTVALLFDGLMGPGQETIPWDGRRCWNTGARIDGTGSGRALPSGAYFARVQTERTTRTVRLVKVR